MLDRTALMQATLRYIIGACYEWEMHAAQFIGSPDDFYQFCLRTHSVCWRYCIGRQTLDGTCSDTECVEAMNMHRAFRDAFDALTK